MSSFDQNVFINCPFDKEFAPILQAILFCVVALGYTPRLATERQDSGETRLDKIKGLIEESRYSVHDLSRCQAREVGEMFRLNMPFELGIDYGCRHFLGGKHAEKKFLILEEKPYRFQAALSDIAGSDIQAHQGDFEIAFKKVRSWLRSETGVAGRGPSDMIGDYYTFQEWHYEDMLSKGYSDEDIKEYETFELLESMQKWFDLGKPI